MALGRGYSKAAMSARLDAIEQALSLARADRSFDDQVAALNAAQARAQDWAAENHWAPSEPGEPEPPLADRYPELGWDMSQIG